MILKYKKFKEDAILESIINESYIYYAPDFKDVIVKMSDNEIANDLISIENTDIAPDVTFIDLDKDGYLSFITMKNAIKLVKKNYTLDNQDAVLRHMSTGSSLILKHLYDYYVQGSEYDSGIFTTSRNEIKIGKFINKLFPEKYTAAQIEDFVNSFKANIKKMELVFELVEGEDIEKWYYYQNYKETKGTLGNSCMSKKTGIFNIYVKNPDVCKLLILRQDDKIVGRALVWKINSLKLIVKNNEITLESIEWFMDRQYTINDSDVMRFRKYAQEKGWAYKSRNNHHSFEFIKLTDEQELEVDMTVKVKKGDYENFPYLDTFRRYDPETGILYNDADEDNQGQFILDDTSGGRTEIGSSDTVWSDWYDDYIPEDESIYSEPLGTYIFSHASIYVEVGSNIYRGYWPDNHDDIITLKDGNNCHIDDAIYSEIYDESILADNALEAVTEINQVGDVDNFSGDNYLDSEAFDNITFGELDNVYWYKVVSEKFSYWNDYKCVIKKIMTKNYKSEWIPKILAINVYRVDNQLDAFGKNTKLIKNLPEYLSKIDAAALGYKTITKDSKIMDKFEYTESISSIEKKILKGLNNIGKHYKDDTDTNIIMNEIISGKEIKERIEEIENNYYKE